MINSSSGWHDTASAEQEDSIIAVFHSVRNELRYFLRAKLGSQDDVDDIMQEMYLRIHNLDGMLLAHIRSPRQYLFRIASNMVNDHGSQRLRKQQVQHAMTVLQESKDSQANCPATIIEGRQSMDLLLQAIASLPPKRRQVFLLYRYRNLSRLQLAKELGMSIDAVDKHLVRALQHCRACLEQGGAD